MNEEQGGRVSRWVSTTQPKTAIVNTVLNESGLVFIKKNTQSVQTKTSLGPDLAKMPLNPSDLQPETCL